MVRPGEQDLYIKLTYSVIREDANRDPSLSKEAEDKQLKKPPKWHMSTLPLPCAPAPPPPGIRACALTATV